jgi:hypothetical protein
MRGKDRQAPLQRGALACRTFGLFASAKQQFKPVRAALAVVFVQRHTFIIRWKGCLTNAGCRGGLSVRLYVTGRGDLQCTVQSEMDCDRYQSLATIDHMI